MKSKAVLAVFGFAAAFALSLPALAQKSSGGYYAGITLGKSNSLNFCDQLGPTCLDQRETWKLLGGQRFNRYFAVEAGYHFLGEAKDENPALELVRFEEIEQGLCMQIMHIGPYAEEARTVEKMMAFAKENGYELRGKHHEIYLGDPRRSKPDRLKTILRYPIKKR